MASNRLIPAIEIKVSSAQMLKLETELKDIKDGVPRAIMSAINKTVSQGRTVAVRELANVLTVKTGNIRARTSVLKATRKKLFGSVTILGRRIGLINFKVKDTGKGKGRGRTGKGVIAQAYKNSPPERFPKAFIAMGKENNKHVFERRRKDGKLAPRLPIFSRKGLSLLDVYKQTPSIQNATETKIKAIFGEKLKSATDWLLNRKNGERPE